MRYNNWLILLCVAFFVLVNDCKSNDLYFTGSIIPNNGQIQNSEIKYYAHSGNQNIYFLNDRISFVTKCNNDSLYQFRFDIKISSIKSKVKLLAVNPEKSRLNYYLPNCPDGIRDVTIFNELIYQNVKDGCDLHITFSEGKPVFYFQSKNSNSLKLDFEFEGITEINKIEANDDIFQITTLAGNTELVIQNSSSEAKIDGNRLFLNVVPSSSQKKVSQVINNELQSSQLSFITYLGGSSFDHLYCIDADENSNLLLCGLTNSSDFPVTAGSYQPIKSGGEDAIILKLDKDSKIDWCTFLGGSAADRAINIYKRDSIIWVSGESLSSDFPITANAHQKNNGGGSADILLMRLDERGYLIHATYHGGSAYDSSPDLAVDSKYNVWVVGRTFSNNFPVTANAYFPNKGNFYDAFMVSVDKNGKLRYSSFFPADQDVFGEGIAVDNSDNVCIAGYTLTDNLPVTKDAYQKTKNQKYDAYLAKFSNIGKPIWVTYFGGNGQDYGSNLTVDPYGNFFIFGFTNSTDLPTSKDVFQPKLNGMFDAFIAKFNNDGEFQWTSYFGGSALEGIGESIYYQIGGVKSDKYGNILVSGQTQSSDMPVTADAFESKMRGQSDAFISKFDVNGKLLYSTYLGGSSIDRGYDVVIDNEGYLVNVGWTDSKDFPVTSNAFQKTYNGAVDAYIFRLKECDVFGEYELIIPNDTLNLASKNIQIPFILKVNSGDTKISKLIVKLRFVKKYYSDIAFTGGKVINTNQLDKYIIYTLEFDNIEAINGIVNLCMINFNSQLPSDFKTKIEIIDFEWSNSCLNTLLKDSEIISVCDAPISTNILIKDSKLPLKSEVDVPLYLVTNDLGRVFINYNSVVTLRYPNDRATLKKITNGIILTKNSVAGFDECLIKINDILINNNEQIISYLTFNFLNDDTTKFFIDLRSVKWYEPCIGSTLFGGNISRGCDEIIFNITIPEGKILANENVNKITVSMNRESGSQANTEINFTEFKVKISDNINVVGFDGLDLLFQNSEPGFISYNLSKNAFTHIGNSMELGNIYYKFISNNIADFSVHFENLKTDDDCKTVKNSNFTIPVGCDSVDLKIAMMDTTVSIGSQFSRNLYFVLNKKIPSQDTLKMSFKLKSTNHSLVINGIQNCDSYIKLSATEYSISKSIPTKPGFDSVKIDLMALLDESDSGIISVYDLVFDYPCLTIDTTELNEIAVEEICIENIRYIDILKRTLVQVTPNPAAETIRISVKSVDDGEVRLVMYNIFGEIVFEHSWLKATGSKQLVENINLSTDHLSSGVYILNLQTSKQVYSEKLIINK